MYNFKLRVRGCAYQQLPRRCGHRNLCVKVSAWQTPFGLGKKQSKQQ